LAFGLTGMDFLNPDDESVRQQVALEARKQGILDIPDFLNKLYDAKGNFIEAKRPETEELLNKIALEYPHSLEKMRHTTGIDRYPDEFKYFETEILPRIISEKISEKKLTLKVIGTSTGGELATLYFYIARAFAKHPQWGKIEDWEIRIQGMDIAKGALDQAKQKLIENPDQWRRMPWEPQEILDTLKNVPKTRRAEIFELIHGNIAFEPHRSEFLKDGDIVVLNTILLYILSSKRREVVESILNYPGFILTNAADFYEVVNPSKNPVQIPEGSPTSAQYFYVVPPEGVQIDQPEIAVLPEIIKDNVEIGIDHIAVYLPTAEEYNSRPENFYRRASHVNAIKNAILSGNIRLEPSRISTLSQISRGKIKTSAQIKKFARELLETAAQTPKPKTERPEARSVSYEQLEQANLKSDIEIRATAIYVALVGLQFKRFTLSEGKKDREQTYEKYTKALSLLISKFGEDAFIETSKQLFDEHLQNLDFYTTIVGKRSRNLRGHKMHSDLQPLAIGYMELAEKFIESSYPIHSNMHDYGSLVNIRTLFGDNDFWKFLRENYPTIFQELADHVQSWPDQVTTGNVYLTLTIYPLGALRKYFADAYEEIRLGAPSFSADDRPAVLILKSTERRLASRGALVSDEDYTADRSQRLEIQTNQFINRIVIPLNRIYSTHQMNHRDKPLTLEEALTPRINPLNLLFPILKGLVNSKTADLDAVEQEVVISHFEHFDRKVLNLAYDPESETFEELKERVYLSVKRHLEETIADIPYARSEARSMGSGRAPSTRTNEVLRKAKSNDQTAVSERIPAPDTAFETAKKKLNLILKEVGVRHLIDDYEFENYTDKGTYSPTPVEAYQKIFNAMELDELTHGIQILDAGSGQGYFSILAAMLYPQIKITGIEFDEKISDASNQILKKAIERELLLPKQVRFIKGDFNDTDFATDFAQADRVYYYSRGTDDEVLLAKTLALNLKRRAKLFIYGKTRNTELEKALNSTNAFNAPDILFDDEIVVFTRNENSYPQRAEMRKKSAKELFHPKTNIPANVDPTMISDQSEAKKLEKWNKRESSAKPFIRAELRDQTLDSLVLGLAPEEALKRAGITRPNAKDLEELRHIEISYEVLKRELETKMDEYLSRLPESEKALFDQNKMRKVIRGWITQLKGNKLTVAVRVSRTEDKLGSESIAEAFENAKGSIERIIVEGSGDPTLLSRLRENKLMFTVLKSLIGARGIQLVDQQVMGVLNGADDAPDGRFFGIEVNDTAGIPADDEPFMRIAEAALQVVIALMIAEEVRDPTELTNPLRLKELRNIISTKLFVGYSGGAIFNLTQGGDVTISRNRLHQFLIQAMGREKMEAAA
jgi:chemotaxis methyl-accepting protein methylase